ncbi:hypothetical protein LR48_Vigan03g243900 [Vigna angularis]|uniref:Uncharacterized protein n=1 Tax=Phaseolus angularis TaxID=3914 RepID=A0A0L9U8V8_PHAAN|nr:hypothetical protein LR48_Vigan03g243900 [Vigna angularis]
MYIPTHLSEWSSRIPAGVGGNSDSFISGNSFLTCLYSGISPCPLKSLLP